MNEAITTVRVIARDEASKVFKRVRGEVDALARGVEADGRLMSGAFSALRGAAGALGLTVGVAAFTNAIHESLKALDNLDERAQTLALPADFLSSLTLTAQAAGIDDVDRALTKFTATLADARSGNEKAERVVKALGISVQGLRDGTVTTEQALRSAANAVAGYADGFEKGNLVQEAFGSKQQKLIALLNGGEAAFTSLTGATKEQIDAGARYAAAIDRLSAAWERLKFVIAGTFANLVVDVPRGPAQQIDDLQIKLRKLEENLDNPRFRKNPEIFARIQAEAQKTRGEIEGLRSALEEASRPQGAKPRAPDVGDKTRTAVAATLSDAEKFLQSLRDQAVAANYTAEQILRIRAAQLGLTEQARAWIDSISAGRAQAEQLRATEQALLDVERQRNDAAEKTAAAYFEQERAADSLLREFETDADRAARRLAELEKLSSSGALARAAQRLGISEFEAYARATEGIMADFEKLQPKVEKTGDLARQLGLTFSSAFEDAIVGGKNLSAILSGLEQDVLRLITRLLITEPLANALAGALRGVVPGLFGGFFGGGDLSGFNYGGGKAAGGRVSAGTAYIVGERRPEIFVPGEDGRIIPNVGGGAVTVNVINNGAPVRAEQHVRRGNNGAIIDVVLREVEADVARGGRVAGAMQRTFGLNRALGLSR